LTKFERILLRIPIVSFLIQKSKQLKVPGFKGLPLYDVIKFFFTQVNKVGLTDRAAVISFNLIMALPAAMLFLFSIIPYLPGSATYKMEILNFLKDLSPTSATYKLIEGILNDLLKKHVGLFSFGFVLLIYYSSSATIGIIRSFDHSIAEKKKFWFNQRWRAIQVTFILILLVIAAALMMVGQELLVDSIRKLFHIKRANLSWLKGVKWIVIVGLFYYGIAFIYKFGPSVKKRWSLQSPGSLLATFLMLATTLAFSYYVNNFGSYNKVYGSIGTVIVLLLLINFNSLILLIGFELNVSITYLDNEEEEEREETERLSNVVGVK